MPREAAHDRLRPVREVLEELAVVDHVADHLGHVVRQVRRVGENRVQLGAEAVRIVAEVFDRRFLEVVRRQEAEQEPHVVEAGLLVGRHERRDTGLRRVAHRAAEFFEGHVFAGHRLDHVGAGDEHVARLADHEDEVGHRGRVDGAAGARAEDHRDLRDDARGLHVAEEDAAVGGEADHALLDAGAGAVVEADHGCADLGGEVHQLVDLLGEHLAERAAEDGEVLREHEHLAPVDGAPPGDHAVGVGPVFEPGGVGPVAGEQVEFVERVLVEEVVEPLAGEHLALLVLAFDRTRRTGVQRLFPSVGEVGDLLFHRHGPEVTPSPRRSPLRDDRPAVSSRPGSVPSGRTWSRMDGTTARRARLGRWPNPTFRGTCRSSRRSSRCWRSWRGRSRRVTTSGCSSRSGTGSAASCSATATGSSCTPAS